MRFNLQVIRKVCVGMWSELNWISETRGLVLMKCEHGMRQVRYEYKDGSNANYEYKHRTMSTIQ